MPRRDANRDRSQQHAKSFWARNWGWIAGGAAVLAACVAIRSIGGPPDANAQAPGGNGLRNVSATSPAATSAADPKQLAAVVNGQEVTRQELAGECLRVFGKEVLESLVNKHLISEYCARNKIVISTKDVDDEIEKMAKKFGIPPEQYLKLLQTERNINPTQYAKDVVWPMIALRRLAASKLTVSPDELKDAYETEYGSAVQCRMIVSEDLKAIKEAYSKAKTNSDDFPNLAKNYSSDANIASAKGLFPPIRRHVGNPDLEQAAFSLKEKEISPIVQVDKQYIILMCENIVPAIQPADFKQIREQLGETIKERKLHAAAAEVFQTLQKDARIVNIYNDPDKSRAMPGVAATVNDTRITMRELAEECIDRHGVEIIEGLINRKLLEQALKKQNVQVTQPHIDQEIAKTAAAMGKVTKNGDPDVEAWLKVVTEENHATVDSYIRDAVWPAAALKLLVGKTVKITDEDLQKGYEANYGPRVRCRAIVVNTQRRAQEVWSLAREKRTAEYFGELAEQYSIEAGSRALKGKVPPIQRHGGQPLLEKEAFSLNPGDLSGIITVSDKFVILFCEGYTEPTKVRFEEVRDLMYEDLYDKKLRIAMNKQYDLLKEQAQVDNYVTGSTHSSKKQQDSEVLPAGGPAPPKGFVTPTAGQGK